MNCRTACAPIWERRANLAVMPPYLAFTKGAIDGMLDISSQVWVEGELRPLDEAWRTRIMTAHDQLAAEGDARAGVGLRILDQPAGRDDRRRRWSAI